jgi:ComF family protein
MGWVNEILDAAAPARCAGCGAPGSAALCAHCLAAVQQLPPQRRLVGGMPAHGAFAYTGVARRSIARGKFRGRRAPLDQLSQLAIARLPWVAGVSLVPVPMTGPRRRERGFNASELLARRLALAWGVPVTPGLQRVRQRGTQVGRSAGARRLSVAGDFRWQGLACGPVVIVDDVVTSGATAMAAASALAAGGIEAVAVVSLAVVG